MILSVISLIVSIIALFIATKPIREKYDWAREIERAHEDRMRHLELANQNKD